MNFLICVDIEKFNEKFSNYVKNIIKHINYNLPIALFNNNINKCSLFFKINNRFYKDIKVEELYYYLNKNTFDINHIENIHNFESYTNLILITNKINYNANDLIIKLINITHNIIIFSLKTLRFEINKANIIRFDEVSKSTINYFTNKINLKENNFTNDNKIDKYIFKIENDKIKQHYDYFLKLKKIDNLNGIVIDKLLLKKIDKLNLDKLNLDNSTKDTLEDLEDSSDSDSENEEYFKSSVSLSSFKQEIKDNSFMGIMINCDKSIYNLIFIPKLINTNFVNEIISYNDFVEIYDNQIKNYSKNNYETINIKKIQINNINSQNYSVNSFIPIYINKRHFSSVKKNLNRYLSKIFTGLETNFDLRYYRIFYKILIDYVYYIFEIGIKKNNLADKDLNLFLNYYRFCCEITKTLGYHKGIYKYLEKLSENFKNTQYAIEYTIAQLMCIGDINKIQEFLSFLKEDTCLRIIPQIINNIIREFGSWTKFLNIFEENSGYFSNLLFMRNIKY